MRQTGAGKQTAVITGGGGALCSAIARHLALQGMQIVLIGRTMEKLERVADQIRSGGGICMPLAGDVSSEGDMREVSREVFSRLGPCHYLINGAGGNQNPAITAKPSFEAAELTDSWPQDQTSFFNMDLDVFESVMRVNVMGTVICCREFGRQMAQAGGGAIVNFASMNSYRPLSRLPAYALSKAGIVNFTQWLAAYLAPADIRVNAIAPGFITNDRNVRLYGSAESGYTERGRKVVAQTPMGRFGRPEDLLGTVGWLLDSSKSGFVTGVTIPVDGGFLTCSGL